MNPGFNLEKKSAAAGLLNANVLRKIFSNAPRKRISTIGIGEAFKKTTPVFRAGISVILLLFLITGAVKGQATEYVDFNHLTTSDGLSQSSIYAMIQDSEGYMWFGTQDGLNKFNGYDFTVYKHDQDDSNSLSLNEIRSIYEDSEGNLFIGTLGRGLNLYDRDNDHFIRFIGDINRPDETLSDNSVWAVYEDSQGNYWIGTSWGLNLFRRSAGNTNEYFTKITHFTTENENPNSLSSNNVTAVYEDSRGNLWVGTDRGLNIMDRETGEFTRFLHNSGDPNSIGANHITTIYEDSKGTLWVGTIGGGLNYFDYENRQFNNYLHNPDNPYSIAVNTVYAIVEDYDGILWIGTSHQGVGLFDRETENFYHHSYDQLNPNSLNNIAVNSLYISRDNTIWIGTFAGGINYTNRQNKRFEHYRSEPYAPQSLSLGVVRSFLETSNGTFLVGTDGGGLNVFDRDTRQFSALYHDPYDPNTIPTDIILDMTEDREGFVWLGTYNGGLSRFDIEGHTFRHFKHDPADPASLSSNDVFKVMEDREGNFWVGTNGGGLNLFDRDTGEFTSFMEDPDDPFSIDNNDVRSIYEDSENNLWIGSYGGQLNRFNRDEHTFNSFDINWGTLYSSVIQVFHEDNGGRFWLGTRGGGLKLFNRQTHEITTFSEQHGLPGNVVNGILEDQQGNLWMSTNSGITRFDPKSQRFTNFGPEDGLQGREFSPGAFYEDQEGYFYFGGVNGFNRFHPDQTEPDLEISKVILTDFQMFNRSVPIGGNSPLEKHISRTEQLTLPYSASVLTFEYAALNFRHLKNDQFAYKLEGFDDDWNEVGTRRSATYTNLSPGEYQFRVRAANSDGIWSEEEAALTLIITPPYWQTVWFYIFSALLIGAIIFLGYRVRVRSIRAHNLQLGREVAERTNELKIKNRDLREALIELEKTKDELVYNAHKAGMADIATGVLHNVGNLLNSVNTSASLIESSVKQSHIKKLEQANDLLKEHIDNFEEYLEANPNGKNLLRYYLMLEEPLKTERKDLLHQSNRLIDKITLINEVIAAQQTYAAASIQADHTSLNDMIDNALMLQTGSIERHRLTVKKELEATDTVLAQRSKLIHVLVNIIKNAKEAMKGNNTGDKILTIKSWQDDKHVYLSVSDNGEGIKKEHLNRIFNHGFTTKTTGHGFGLHSSANYMAEMGGKIEVTSEGPGKGATFIISLRISSKPAKPE